MWDRDERDRTGPIKLGRIHFRRNGLYLHVLDYIECQRCGVVLKSGSPNAPEPKNRDTCPECDGAHFRFAISEPSILNDGVTAGIQ